MGDTCLLLLCVCHMYEHPSPRESIHSACAYEMSCRPPPHTSPSATADRFLSKFFCIFPSSPRSSPLPPLPPTRPPPMGKRTQLSYCLNYIGPRTHDTTPRGSRPPATNLTAPRPPVRPARGPAPQGQPGRRNTRLLPSPDLVAPRATYAFRARKRPVFHIPSIRVSVRARRIRWVPCLYTRD